jgi:cytochrome bd-type quinol oxidase subunit 2
MSLSTLWFVIIAVLWTGFFVLEGFDFGVGALHRTVGRSEPERRLAVNAIGPLWDGNEVWLIVGGAAIFAAFPVWYATWFSAGYLALLLILVALILRGLSFDWRGKRESPRWRTAWSWSLVVGSVLAPLLLGVALGDLLAGLPINADGEFTGNFWSLLTPYGLWFGVTLLGLCLLHGSAFLALKTDGPVRDRAGALLRALVVVGLVLVAVEATWTVALSDAPVAANGLAVIPVLSALASLVLLARGRDGWLFVATAVTIGGTTAALFANLYPNVMLSSTAAANNLTVTSTSSAHYALSVMTVVALVLLPVVLIYQGWTYWVFRARLQPPNTEVADSTAVGGHPNHD